MQRKRRKPDSILAECHAVVNEIALKEKASESNLHSAVVHNLKAYFAGGGDGTLYDVSLLGIAFWVLTCKRMSCDCCAIKLINNHITDINDTTTIDVLSDLSAAQQSIVSVLGWFISASAIDVSQSLNLPSTVLSLTTNYIEQLYSSTLCVSYSSRELSNAVVIVACRQSGHPIPIKSSECSQEIIDKLSSIVLQ